MRDERNDIPEDDGRTIVDMNVEGMPWYQDKHEPRKQLFGKQQAKRPQVAQDLSREEEWAILWGSIKAALLIGAVFTVCAVAFILFCQLVWLR